MFKITIEEIKEIEIEKQGTYAQFSSEYLDSKDFHTLSYEAQRGYKQIEAPNGTVQYEKNIYGYSPNTKVITDQITKLYEQTVDSIKLSDVIKSVNGI